MPHLLSKSKYIRGLQCERALWLDVHNPRLARYSAEQMRLFDRGREFEYAFKDSFPGGIDISAELKRDVDAYPARTAALLAQPGEVVLFEAGFLFDDVLVLADVVHKQADGTLDIYEVKSGSTLSQTYRNDAAVQHHVIAHCQPRVRSFSIVFNGGNGRFETVDLTEELRAEDSRVAANIAAMKDVVMGDEPDTPTGSHCLEPYACPYRHYCSLGVRQLSLFKL